MIFGFCEQKKPVNLPVSILRRKTLVLVLPCCVSTGGLAFPQGRCSDAGCTRNSTTRWKPLRWQIFSSLHSIRGSGHCKLPNQIPCCHSVSCTECHQGKPILTHCYLFPSTRTTRGWCYMVSGSSLCHCLWWWVKRKGDHYLQIQTRSLVSSLKASKLHCSL